MKTKQYSKTDSKKLDNSDVSLVGGGALGALAIGEMLILGTVCPVCVVGGAGLLGYGAYNKLKKRRNYKSVKNN